MQLTWDIRFLAMAGLVGSWSKDPSTKVGAVIADSCNRNVSVGFNGFPKGVIDDPALYADKEYKHKVIIHAETNAILFAGRELHGCSIYTDPLPTCSVCASLIIQSGICRVVSYDLEEGTKERWRDSFILAKDMYEQAGVEFITYPRNINETKIYKNSEL